MSGPIRVADTEVSAATVVNLIALDQYWETDAVVQRERMAAIAAGSFAAVSDPSVGVFALASGLAEAAAGRHLMAWSSDASQQAAWEALEIAGTLKPESLMISVLNRGANKLDTFLDVSATATSAALEETIEVELAITLSNRTGPGLPDYVLGPAQALEVSPGTYVGMLTVNCRPAPRTLHFGMSSRWWLTGQLRCGACG